MGFDKLCATKRFNFFSASKSKIKIFNICDLFDLNKKNNGSIRDCQTGSKLKPNQRQLKKKYKKWIKDYLSKKLVVSGIKNWLVLKSSQMKSKDSLNLKIFMVKKFLGIIIELYFNHNFTNFDENAGFKILNTEEEFSGLVIIYRKISSQLTKHFKVKRVQLEPFGTEAVSGAVSVETNFAAGQTVNRVAVTVSALEKSLPGERVGRNGCGSLAQFFAALEAELFPDNVKEGARLLQDRCVPTVNSSSSHQKRALNLKKSDT
ncbi:hypothetical protein BpHYR1_036604 [Brachionus plicatilis]|uniref:Uncharacterized protein n=1 Tax=Brachionus plicatilis TaxID=10195 RepID=A0A3M7T3A2_BRAPC|nr:hypothetical protein BpHYR1_036604 [Brachionus plicatilis]